MDVKVAHSGVAAVAVELNLDLQLILRDDLAAHRAGRTGPRSAPGPIGSAGRQLSATDRFAGLLAEDELFGHGGIPQPGRQYRV